MPREPATSRSTDPTDPAALLRRVAAGDTEAFAGIVRRYQGPLFGYLGRMGLVQAVCEELVQEAFLRAWRGLAGYDPRRAAFSTWLFAIARNLALNELARPARQAETAADDTLSEPAADQPGPAEALAQRQRQERLRGALRQLAAADRSVLALACEQELPLEAVARIEGCSTGAVKTRLHRARERLKQLFFSEMDDG